MAIYLQDRMIIQYQNFDNFDNGIDKNIHFDILGVLTFK